MKKAVAFLLAFLIFVTPMTTLVKADVVIGDNDDTIINENATILGRKLALMESLSDLALSGVTEFTISNTNDVDSYLDYLWEELDSAIESLSDGTGFTEISNELKSKYFTNLVQYKDYITNRGNYLAQLLPTGNPTTTLLSTFFANNIYGKQITQHYDLALDMFRSLSAFSNDDNPTPQPDPDFSFIQNINNYYIGDLDFFDSNTPFQQYNRTYDLSKSYDFRNYSFYAYDNSSTSNFQLSHVPNNSSQVRFMSYSGIRDIYITGNNSYNVVYETLSNSPIFNDYQLYTYKMYNKTISTVGVYFYNDDTYQPRTQFDDLSTCINYIYSHFCNVNVYVNGEPWALAESGSILNPTLDIDGFLKLYGNDTPQQYEIQPNTKIDYDQLYQVIYNAIRNNLPISQGDINYYDSHDTIYSPTIINNYGEEEGDESDLIDTILDYAVIPKFDTAIAQPMRSALTNGVVIMQNSITNVIPDEILLILGACFFLLLFAVVINRMIK